jgi:hypothetical protein
MIGTMSETDRQPRWRPRDWLLAESIRRLDEDRGDAVVDDAATLEAARRPGDPAARIVARARRTESGRELAPVVDRVLAGIRWLVLAIAGFGFVFGAVAAAGMRTGDATIAVSYALFVLLGLPLAMLALWTLLTLVAGTRRSGAPGVPGRLLARALAARPPFGRDRPQRAALAAAVGELARRRSTALAATATHAFWSAFHLGSVAWLLVLFLGLRFDFSWETTLLSGAWLAEAIHALGAPPALLPGVDQPSAAQVQAVLTDQSRPSERRLWAGFLIGSLLVYGLAPRLLLALLFAWRWRRTRLPLDLARPGYLALLPALSASSAHAPPGDPTPRPARAQAPRRRPGGGPAVAVGIELGDEADWPPALPDCRVLGRADDRHQRRELLAALARLDPSPSRIVALCSLDRTPDRGTARFLCELADLAPIEIRLVGRHADRQRVADWRRLAQRFGLPEPVGPETDGGR